MGTTLNKPRDPVLEPTKIRQTRQNQMRRCLATRPIEDHSEYHGARQESGDAFKPKRLIITKYFWCTLTKLICSDDDHGLSQRCLFGEPERRESCREQLPILHTVDQRSMISVRS